MLQISFQIRVQSYRGVSTVVQLMIVISSASLSAKLLLAAAFSNCHFNIVKVVRLLSCHGRQKF